MVGIALTLGLLLVFGHKKRLRKVNGYLLSIFTFYGLIIGHTVFFSTDFEMSIERASFSSAVILMFYFFIHYSKIFVNILKYYIFALTGFILCTSDAMLALSPGLASTQFDGVFLNPNILGFHISIVALPYFLNKAFRGFFKNSRIISFNNFVALNLLILVVLTKARASMLVTAFVCLLLLLRYEKRTIAKIKVLSTIALMGLIIGSTTNVIQSLVNKYEGQSSVFQTREYLYLSRINGISQRPLLGWGFQVNPTHGRYEKYHSSNKLEKGNMYLALLEEFGVFIGLGMIFIIFYIAKKSFDIPNSYFFMTLTITATVLHLNFESWFLNFNAINTFIFWLYVLLVASLPKKLNESTALYTGPSQFTHL